MGVLIGAPITLCIAKATCWRCGKKTRVLSIYSDNIFEKNKDGSLRKTLDETYLIYITNLPDEILKFIKQFFPFYNIDYSKTVGYKYYMNHCEYCNSKQGDFFLYNDGGMARNVFTLEKSKRFLIQLPIDKMCEIEGTYDYALLVKATMLGINHYANKMTLKEYNEARKEYYRERALRHN